MSQHRSVLFAYALVLSSCAISTPAGAQSEPRHPKIEKALSLLENGRAARAEKAFAALLAEAPELRFEVRLAQAEYANRKNDFETAARHAAEAADLAPDDRSRALAVGEQAVAAASLAQDPSGLGAQLAIIRGELGPEEDSVTDRLRIQLCHIRELLDPEHPDSIAKAAMPEGTVKYLPRVEPGSADTAVRPERISDREAIPRGEAAKSLRGRMTAQIQGTIDADGCFAKARVSSATNEEFKSVALEAVRGWVYRPARFNGSAVALFFSSTLTFDAGDPGKRVY